MRRAARLQGLAFVGFALAGPAGAIDTIEAVGAQKCGGRVKSYAVEFLAPDNAELEANWLRGRTPDPRLEKAIPFARLTVAVTGPASDVFQQIGRLQRKI
jgi:hypothetical protein